MSTAPHTENTPGATETTTPAHPEPQPITNAAGQDLPPPEEVTAEGQPGSCSHLGAEEPEMIRVSRLPPAPPPVFAQPDMDEIVSTLDQVQLAEITQYRAVTRHPPFPPAPHEEDTCVAENAPPARGLVAESAGELAGEPAELPDALIGERPGTDADPTNDTAPANGTESTNSVEFTNGMEPAQGVDPIDAFELIDDVYLTDGVDPAGDFHAINAENSTDTYTAIPTESKLHQWNRLALSAAPYRDMWREEMATLDDPLPPEIRPPHRFAAGIIIYSIEVLLGHRAPGYVRPHLSPEVFAALVRRAGLAMRIKGKAPWLGNLRISTLKITHPRPRVAEVIACVYSGERTHAVAMRMEFLAGRWIVVALEIG
ncbi:MULTISPECIES: Rv3235 family protein [Actinotignum]|uniref:Rv3235 family protein n=2 Tax=Actinotignum timonense TaxID=1870995 RepID=A0AAW9HMU5_9ACTO|nr:MULTISPECIES: Rv3235 family protein [Actinotignum]MDE1557581.1 Rv3235 family protein [Actinotignum schaalii]MDE1662508.1 Rv3235 family protein [Actinotignum schaalii]MDK6372830.1 Rv3235 family protein [Actinotignum timonense]MDK6418165.1 Rv3235 family protein [Actinotignum timonense]MDK6590099.1 Rv3235 family protein [Actinotignum timonense]